jgi:hypothetical protein
MADPLEEVRARLREAIAEAESSRRDRFDAGRREGLLEALGIVYELLERRGEEAARPDPDRSK